MNYEETAAHKAKEALRTAFTAVYVNNAWNSEESRSGNGSTIAATAEIRAALPRIVQEYAIQTVLDIPCGDYHWMQHVALSAEYLGADIVPELIAKNIQEYGNKFLQLDLLHDRLPCADLILCRDCLVHLSVTDVLIALHNVVSSGAKYLLTTTFTDRQNDNLPATSAGVRQWCPFNLQAAPFNLPPPILLINENCQEKYPKYIDKSLGLWRAGDLLCNQ